MAAPMLFYIQSNNLKYFLNRAIGSGSPFASSIRSSLPVRGLHGACCFNCKALHNKRKVEPVALLLRIPILSLSVSGFKLGGVRQLSKDSERSGSSSDSDSSSDSTEHEEEYEEESDEGLYAGHIPTTTFQKFLLSVGAALVTITCPQRGDMLAAFGEASGHRSLEWLKKQMEADPVGRQILLERPRINSRTVDLIRLRSLDEGTFGRAYADWLEENRASPDDRLPVEFVDDVDLAYVMTRYREVHDLLHCLLGMPTNMIGEVTVKVYEGIQTRLPMCVTGGIFGPLRLGPKHARLYFRTHFSWAVRNGLNSKNVMNVYFERHWEDQLNDLRQQLNIEHPPYTPAKRLFKSAMA